MPKILTTWADLGRQKKLRSDNDLIQKLLAWRSILAIPQEGAALSQKQELLWMDIGMGRLETQHSGYLPAQDFAQPVSSLVILTSHFPKFKKRQRNKETFHPLVQSPCAGHSQIWTTLQSGVSNPIGVSHAGFRHSNRSAISCCLPGCPLKSSWIRSKGVRTWTRNTNRNWTVVWNNCSHLLLNFR